MKLYSITNRYQGGVQQGIQTQHGCTRLLMKYRPCNDLVDEDLIEMAETWATEHETTVVLSGGGHPELKALHEKLIELGDEFQYPYAVFTEPGLNDSYTCVCFVLDEYAVAGMKKVRESRDPENMTTYFTHGVAEIMVEVMNMRLA